MLIVHSNNEEDTIEIVSKTSLKNYNSNYDKFQTIVRSF